MSAIEEITFLNFNKQVIRSAQPVLVTFYTDQCRSSYAIMPMLERLASLFIGRAALVKIDIHKEPELARHFSITETPGFAFFRNRRDVGKAVGIVKETILHNFLDELIQVSTATQWRETIRGSFG